MNHSHEMPQEIKVENLLKYRERLFRFVQNRVNDFDQAEDIFQDSLLKALQKAPEFSAEEKLLSWFYTILRNSIVDSYRKQGTNDKKIDSLVQSFPPRVKYRNRKGPMSMLYRITSRIEL